eukprot:6487672-Alexandrium_andersonii.AAC.1
MQSELVREASTPLGPILAVSMVRWSTGLFACKTTTVLDSKDPGRPREDSDGVPLRTAPDGS